MGAERPQGGGDTGKCGHTGRRQVVGDEGGHQLGQPGSHRLGDTGDVGLDQTVTGGLPLEGVGVRQRDWGVLHVEDLADGWVTGQGLDHRANGRSVVPEGVGVVQRIGDDHAVREQRSQRVVRRLGQGGDRDAESVRFVRRDHAVAARAGDDSQSAGA